jgi:hypothetical protein
MRAVYPGLTVTFMCNPSHGSGSSAVSDARHKVANTGQKPRVLLALGLWAVLTASSVAVSPAMARAQGGQDNQGTADLTFTKWAIAPRTGPTTRADILMDSITGRDVGPAGFTGEVLRGDIRFRPGFWLGHARYELRGPAFTFIADISLANGDTSLPITATIRGVVTKGRFNGARVTGEYTQLDRCPMPRPGRMVGIACWQVTLHVMSEDRTGSATHGVA